MNEAILDAVPAQTPEKPIRPFPGIWTSILWVVLFFAINFTVSVVALIVAAITHSPSAADVASFLQLVSDIKFIAIPTIWGLFTSSVLTLGALWLLLRKKERYAALQLDRWSQIGIGKTLIYAVLIVGAGMIFGELYSRYIIPDIKIQEQMRQIFNALPKTPLYAAVLFLSATILAPVLEEIIFRGFLQTSITRLAGPLSGILIAAAVFAAMHFDFYAFPVLFALGAGFGWLYQLTGSLRVNIILHILNNLAAILFT